MISDIYKHMLQIDLVFILSDLPEWCLVLGHRSWDNALILCGSRQKDSSNESRQTGQALRNEWWGF